MAHRAFQEQLCSRYGDQREHQPLAGPSVGGIAHAKRAAARRGALAAGAGDDDNDDASDGFVPLVASSAPRSRRRRAFVVADEEGEYAGPHPESGLQREEDDLGDAEEEHAEFTGATERIPLGRAAEQRRKEQRRRHIRSLIESAGGGGDADDDDDDDIAVVVRERAPPKPATPAATTQTAAAGPDYEEDPLLGAAAAPLRHLEPEAGDSEDEEERRAQDEWERAQLSRMDMPGSRQRAEHRERSPHRTAPVPLTAALPTPTSCLSRLQTRLSALNESSATHEAKIAEAERALETIAADEALNKASVDDYETRAAWFTELDAFAETLAAFLDEKTPQLEALEEAALRLLEERAATAQHARSLRLEDALALFHGVSAASLMPRPAGEDAESEAARPTEADGPWDAPARQARRAQAQLPPSVPAFAERREKLLEEQEHLLADTHAPEFRDPAATAEDGSPHPRSLVVRFGEWRASYADEYNLAYGGLALANAWEFWARRELALWDPLRRTAAGPTEAQDELTGPASGLEGLAWQHALSHYVEAGGGSPQGGDDEALSTLVSNVVVARLIAVAERAYDPWNEHETHAALELVEQVSYVLDARGWRFQVRVRSALSC